MMNQFKLPMHPCIIWYSSNKDDSLGLFFIGGVFQHYIIGDESRDVKVKHETRIRKGIYTLQLRLVGGFHNRYTKKFPKMHEGMIEVNTPDFDYLLYHIMNDEGNTSGCIGGGDTANNNKIKAGFVGSSTAAYKRTYPIFLHYVKSTANPVIEVIDLDR